MATVREVDEVALALSNRSRAALSTPAESFRAAWEAWGMWANGGFELILTGGLADEAEHVVASLRYVGAEREASLFEQAFGLVDGGIDRRNEQWCEDEELQAHAGRLDRAVADLPDLTEAVLAPMLDRVPALRNSLS